jgi:transposase
MFIRKFTTQKSKTGKPYFGFRLVESLRLSSTKTTQKVLLNLGADFNVPKESWPYLCKRIEFHLNGKREMLPYIYEPELEALAKSIAGKLWPKLELDAEKRFQPKEKTKGNLITGEEDSFELVDSRSVGVEHVALHSAMLMKLPELFHSLGFSDEEIKLALITIVSRMAHPASERETFRWVTENSSLEELLDIEIEPKSVMCLHRISDILIDHKDEIESNIFDNVKTLFNFNKTITLYDLTNTYFEGNPNTSKAKRGHSKEKRTDCPLVTLALVLDGSGFIRRTEVFPGNASEPATMAVMLNKIGGDSDSLVIMDRGIATAANVDWLNEKKYKYLVVNREQHRTFDFKKAETITVAGGYDINIYKEVTDDGSEARLYCHSPKRQAKEEGMTARKAELFEKEINKINEGLSKPRCEKRKDKVMQRIGRLLEKTTGMSRHYTVLVTDNGKEKKEEDPLLATSVTFEKKPLEGTMLTKPGVYCLKTNNLSISAEDMWRTYIQLTDIEAVFRSLKSELGMRPIYHTEEKRIEGHLFITAIAYQCVHTLRKMLKKEGINDSWETIRQRMTGHDRATIILELADGTDLHYRMAFRPQPWHRKIYNALGLTGRPGGVKKQVVKRLSHLASEK